MNSLLKNNKTLRGDTIVEVLIAMAVLGLVLTSAFAISNRSYATGISARERSEALEIAESQLELLRVASNSADDSLLDMTNPADPTLFCIDSGATILDRIDFDFGVTVEETQGLIDPINYPVGCQIGTDNRYKVSIEETPLLDINGVATEGKIFSVRVRWQSIVGNIIDEVNHEYRTYKFDEALLLSGN
jgi:type II secretory pathway pseudopilin PulG